MGKVKMTYSQWEEKISIDKQIKVTMINKLKEIEGILSSVDEQLTDHGFSTIDHVYERDKLDDIQTAMGYLEAFAEWAPTTFKTAIEKKLKSKIGEAKTCLASIKKPDLEVFSK